MSSKNNHEKTRKLCLSILTAADRDGCRVPSLSRDVWRKQKPESVTRYFADRLSWPAIKKAVADAMGGMADRPVSELILTGRIDVEAVAEAAASRLLIPTDVKPPKKPTDSHRQQKAELRDRQEKRDLLERLVAAEDTIAAFQAAAQREAPPPLTWSPNAGLRDGGVMLLLGDWHPGDRVVAETVGGHNAFDREVAKERVASLIRGFAWTLEMWRTAYDIREIVIGVLGDMITGWIHEEQLVSTSMTPPEEVLFCSDLLESALAEVLGMGFERARVVCVTGNHGRITKRIHHSNRGRTSYEWVIYHDLVRRLGSDRVTFNIPNSEFAFETVCGLDVRFTHGDFFRYAGGVGGIQVPMKKAIHRQNAARHADLTCMGHWHQYLHDSDSDVIVNDSLRGYDAFAQHCGFKPHPASQTAILIDAKRGFPWPKRIWV